jgi:subtilisin family serine protease
MLFLVLSPSVFAAEAGELIVKTKTSQKVLKDVDVLQFEKVLGNTNSHGKKLGLDKFYVVKVKPGKMDKVIERLKRHPNIEYVEPNYELEIDVMPNDPDFSLLYGLHNDNDTDIDAPEAWDIRTGSDVVIAVIDTGVDINHPDLKNNIYTNPDEIAGNGIDDDGNGYVDDVNGWNAREDDGYVMDDHGHGTHCAGTIAAVGSYSVVSESQRSSKVRASDSSKIILFSINSFKAPDVILGVVFAEIACSNLNTPAFPSTAAPFNGA